MWHGLPDKITIPGGASKRVPMVADFITIGWVEANGDVLWGDLGLVKPATATSLKFRSWRAVISGGEVIAVVAGRPR